MVDYTQKTQQECILRTETRDIIEQLMHITKFAYISFYFTNDLNRKGFRYFLNSSDDIVPSTAIDMETALRMSSSIKYLEVDIYPGWQSLPYPIIMGLDSCAVSIPELGKFTPYSSKENEITNVFKSRHIPIVEEMLQLESPHEHRRRRLQ